MRPKVGKMLIERVDDGPALNYKNENSKGQFGVIAPYSKDFAKRAID